MIWHFIRTVLQQSRSTSKKTLRRKLIFEGCPDVIYAIGDVHGCCDLLLTLKQAIIADAQQVSGTKLLIFLGDYVDRGPQSAAVLDLLMSQSIPNIQCICLAGNHEDVMLDFISTPYRNHPWLKHGGLETLHSYGIYELPNSRRKLKTLLDHHIPEEHITFLKSLPSLCSFRNYCFVHAGIEDGVPLREQKDAILLWTRTTALIGASKNAFTIVHGHTPVETVYISNSHINVDTGAYQSGVLSAIKITVNGKITILST